MKYVIFVAMAALLAACSPTNQHDCLMQAAKAGSNEGVKIATYACFEKFPK